MVFVIVGVLLVLMKALAFGPVAEWEWWWVLLPFGLAVAWWGFADSSGLTQRRAMRRMDERTAARRERNMDALGLNVGRESKVAAAREAARRKQAREGKPPEAR